MCDGMQVQEVTEHEPDCKVYFALTKCDLLEQPPAVGSNGSQLDPSPQESGASSNLLLQLCWTLCWYASLSPHQTHVQHPCLLGPISSSLCMKCL